jgi:hypothetical protein
MVGIIAGVMVIWAVFARFVWPWLRRQYDWRLHLAVTLTMAVLLALWGWGGSLWLENEWPDVRIAWPLWVKVVSQASSFATMWAIGWGMWRLWTEIVDPHGPTPPRMATDRQGVILPWQHEAGETPPVQHVWRIEMPRINGNQTQESAIEGIDPWAWYQFARAVVNGKNFSVRTAKAAGIPTTAPNKHQQSPWDRLVAEWDTLEWIEKAGARGTHTVLEAGMERLELVASTPPPRASVN